MDEVQKVAYGLEQQKANIAATELGLSIPGRMGYSEDTSIIKEQLSLGSELEVLDNLIQSKSLVFNPQTQVQEWTLPDVEKDIRNEDLIILSEYGVHYFRQVIAAYLNKNTLLSNYEYEDINKKMYDIATTINDEIFLSYEKLFKMPSLERCEKEIEEDIKEKLELRKYASKVMGYTLNEDEEKLKILEKLEYELEKKIIKVRQKLFSNKLKRFTFILRFIQDTIHSAYMRAMGGQERRSIRQHMTVVETKGIKEGNEEKGGGLAWLTRKRS